MDTSMSGWVKLHRSSVDSRVFRNKDLWRLWTWILMSVNYRESWADENTKVLPGQMLIGREFVGKALKVKPRTVYDWLKKLELFEMITLKPNNAGTILTVCNWTTYQDCENEIQQRANNEPTTSQQRANNEPTLRKKGKNVKKGKKGKNNSLFVDPDIVEEIYQAYPKKTGKGHALKSIESALKKVDAETLLEAVKEFAEAKRGDDPKYIKNPATWFNAECWKDDRSTWVASRAGPADNSPAAKRERTRQAIIDGGNSLYDEITKNQDDVPEVRKISGSSDFADPLF